MKKGIGRLLAFTLSMLMVMTLLPGMVFAESSLYTVYVSETGADTNTGEQNSPVATLSQAYSVLGTKMTDAPSGSEGTVVISGTITQSANLPSFTSYPVTLMGATPQDGINVTINATTIYVGGPTTFKNITLTHNGKNSNYMLNLGGKGYPITIDEGVTVVPKKHSSQDRYYYIGLVGGAYGASLASGRTSTSLTIKSGSWRYIVGGSITTNSTLRTVSGNVTVNMTGGTVVPAVTSGDGDFCGAVGKVGGKITINIGGNAVVNRPVYDLRTSSYYTMSADTYESCEINITGGQVKAGVVRNNAEGSFAANIDLTGGKTAFLGGTCNMTNLTGGGTLTLDDAASLNLTGTVTGTTTVAIDGTVQDDAYIVTPLGVNASAFDYDGEEGEALVPEEVEGKLNWSVGEVSTSEYAVTINTVEGATTSVSAATSTGAAVNYTVVPQFGYYITGITVGGEAYTGFDAYKGGTYSTGDIAADTDIVVTVASLAANDKGVSTDVATLPSAFGSVESSVTFGKVLDANATSWGVELTQNGQPVLTYHGGGPLYKANTKNANGQYAVEFVGLAAGEYQVRTYVIVDGVKTFGAPATFVVE